MDQSNLLKNLEEFHERYKPNTAEGKYKEKNTFESVNSLFEVEN